MYNIHISVSNIQRGCVYDGKGVRTTVFLRGCSLRCPWCCNPETWVSNQFYINKSKCLYYIGITSPLCDGCFANSKENIDINCKFNAIKIISSDYTINSLFDFLSHDFKQMVNTQGGVTFSGGEPLLQAAELLNLLQRLKDSHIDICFETSLVVPSQNLQLVLPYTDEFIIDLKLQPEMLLFDEKYIPDIKEKVSRMQASTRITYRLVFVDSIINHKSKVIESLKELDISSIELIRAHNLGASKYKQLELNGIDYTANECLFLEFSNLLNMNQIKTFHISI